MVELFNKFDEKSSASVCKGESIAKVPFKLFGVTYIMYVIHAIQK